MESDICNLKSQVDSITDREASATDQSIKNEPISFTNELKVSS